ncbi:hypothetical protein ACFW5I_09955 [Streptomyces sp. NPDC058818]|uniref:hypothetical protein n=1 Tax=Streptomyces sp. NPDC058818 TaxID=3346640 RepID=UPI0036CB6B30
MHRTTTTATLLVTVAVSALTGCTTVQGPTAADPSAAGARSSAPRPDGPSEPRVVQAPAREALEMIGPSGPSRTPDHASGEPRRTASPEAAPPQRKPPATRARPEQRPRTAHPGAPEREQGRERSRVEVPDVPRPTGRGTGENTDVCSLGRQYGGWRPGSPEAVICEQAYGR